MSARTLIVIAGLGLAVGWFFGTRRWSGWLVALLIVSLGVVAVFVRVGQLGGLLLDLIRLMAQSSGYLPGWQPQVDFALASTPESAGRPESAR